MAIRDETGYQQQSTDRSEYAAQVITSDGAGTWRCRILSVDGSSFANTSRYQPQVRPAISGTTLNTGEQVWIREYLGQWYAWKIPTANSLGLTDCPCLDCVQAGSVEDCESLASPAVHVYQVTLAEWDEFPEIAGVRTLSHASGCTWDSDDITHLNEDESDSVYKLRLNCGASPPTLSLVHVSGDDTVSPLSYQATRPFDPLCPNRFDIIQASLIRNRTGLACQLCLRPYQSCDDFGPFPAAYRLRTEDCTDPFWQDLNMVATFVTSPVVNPPCVPSVPMNANPDCQWTGSLVTNLGYVDDTCLLFHCYYYNTAELPDEPLFRFGIGVSGLPSPNATFLYKWAFAQPAADTAWTGFRVAGNTAGLISLSNGYTTGGLTSGTLIIEPA